MTQPPSISDQLRAAVRASGLSCWKLGYGLCRPQLDPSLISRFLVGKRSLTLRSADSLARALGFRLVADGDSEPAGSPSPPVAGRSRPAGDDPYPGLRGASIETGEIVDPAR